MFEFLQRLPRSCCSRENGKRSHLLATLSLLRVSEPIDLPSKPLKNTEEILEIGEVSLSWRRQLLANWIALDRFTETITNCPSRTECEIHAHCHPQCRNRRLEFLRGQPGRALQGEKSLLPAGEIHKTRTYREVGSKPGLPVSKIQQEITDNGVLRTGSRLLVENASGFGRLSRSQREPIPVPNVVTLDAEVIRQMNTAEDVYSRTILGLVE